MFCAKYAVGCVREPSALRTPAVALDRTFHTFVDKYHSMEQVGAAANRSAAQVGLRWVLDRAPSLVVKASKREYLLDDLDVFGWALPSDAIAELDAATTPQGQQEGRPSWGCAK